MDLDEWELLPDDGFLEIHDDGGKKIFSRRYGDDDPRKNVFKTNYFICPSPPKSPKFAGPLANQRVPNQLVLPVPIQLEQAGGDKAHDHEQVKEVVTSEVPVDQKIKAPKDLGAADQETVSQVFFKKMKENEFVDMKMDSPRSSGRGIVPQIDAAGTFQFEDRGEKKNEKETTVIKKTNLDSDSKEQGEEQEVSSWEEKNGGSNIWKRSLTGIGAICSFGVAAATICIIICGTHHQKNKQQHQQNQKRQYQIYADDKRIKQVVHHATRLNEAISAVRGVPLTRAHITIGGYYDGL